MGSSGVPVFELALSAVPSVGGSVVLLEGAAVTSSLTASALSSMLQLLPLLLLLLLTGSLLLSSLSLLLSGLSATPVGACCSVWSMSVASSWEPQGTSLSAASASGPDPVHASDWVLLDGSALRRNDGVTANIPRFSLLPTFGDFTGVHKHNIQLLFVKVSKEQEQGWIKFTGYSPSSRANDLITAVT